MAKRSVTRAIPIHQLGGNDDEYSETEYIAWKDTKSSIESGEFGSLAIKILNIISYFDYKFVVPTAIFTEPNSDKALKVLADKKLITFQNEDKEFTIYRPFQLINTQKLRFHRFENDALESAVQLLEKVINLPEYSNQNTIILIDHAKSAWNYVNDCEDCQDVIRNHAKFPVNILTKLITDLDSDESVKFGEKTTKRYGEVLGAFNENALHVETLTGVSYDLIKDYDKSLSVLNKILIDYKDYSEKYDKIYLLAKYGKAQALLEKDGNSKEGVELLDDVIKQSELKLGEGDPITLTAKWKKISHTYLEGDDADHALELVNEVLPIALKYDPNSDQIITLQLQLQKAILLSVQEQYDLSRKIFEEIKSKIIYTDRNNVMEFTYIVGLAAAYLREFKLKEAIDLITGLKETAQKYLSKDDRMFKDINEFLGSIPSEVKTKRSINYKPLEYLRTDNNIWPLNTSLAFIQDFKSNCLIEGQKLIENVTSNDTFTTKPIVSTSVNDSYNLLFLIDVFLKKITGNKYSKLIDDAFVPTKYNLNVAVINICEKLENIFFNTLKNPEQFNYAELQSVLRSALEKCSNGRKVSNILKKYIQKNMISPEDDDDLNTLYDLIYQVITDNCDD